MTTTNPSTFYNSPLIFKGAFSSNIPFRVRVKYNYIYDRLYHVKFTGIVKYDAQVDDKELLLHKVASVFKIDHDYNFNKIHIATKEDLESFATKLFLSRLELPTIFAGETENKIFNYYINSHIDLLFSSLNKHAEAFDNQELFQLSVHIITEELLQAYKNLNWGGVYQKDTQLNLVVNHFDIISSIQFKLKERHVNVSNDTLFNIVNELIYLDTELETKLNRLIEHIVKKSSDLLSHISNIKKVNMKHDHVFENIRNLHQSNLLKSVELDFILKNKAQIFTDQKVEKLIFLGIEEKTKNVKLNINNFEVLYDRVFKSDITKDIDLNSTFNSVKINFNSYEEDFVDLNLLRPTNVHLETQQLSKMVVNSIKEEKFIDFKKSLFDIEQEKLILHNLILDVDSVVNYENIIFKNVFDFTMETKLDFNKIFDSITIDFQELFDLSLRMDGEVNKEKVSTTFKNYEIDLSVTLDSSILKSKSLSIEKELYVFRQIDEMIIAKDDFYTLYRQLTALEDNGLQVKNIKSKVIDKIKEIEFTQEYTKLKNALVDNLEFIEKELNVIQSINDHQEQRLEYPMVFPEIKNKIRENLEQDVEFEIESLQLTSDRPICTDYLHFPLKEFNQEKALLFYDENLNPYYPTGQVDEDGNPYVLPPYTVLNEPIANGANVGGKSKIAISPLNLSEYILYLIRMYDKYKRSFQVDNPIHVMSIVMNRLFDQTQSLVSQINEESNYTADELWRIYRFIRWLAIGVTAQYYKLKVTKIYGDLIEDFQDSTYLSGLIINGAVRSLNNTKVLDAKPSLSSQTKEVTLNFDYSRINHTTYLEFEIGNEVPDRPNQVNPSGVVFEENFEGEQKIFANNMSIQTINGSKRLAVNKPTTSLSYTTNTFEVAEKYYNCNLSFNYLLDSNMNTQFYLRNTEGTFFRSLPKGTTSKSYTIPSGNYYFELNVPYAEDEEVNLRNFKPSDMVTFWYQQGYNRTTVVTKEITNTSWIYDKNHFTSVIEIYNSNNILLKSIIWDKSPNEFIGLPYAPRYYLRFDSTGVDYEDEASPYIFHINPSFLSNDGVYTVKVHPAEPDIYAKFNKISTIEVKTITEYIDFWTYDNDYVKAIDDIPNVATLVNPAWLNNTNYVFEVEFCAYTLPTITSLGFVGVVFGYQDINNYYAFGLKGSDPLSRKTGVWRNVNGQSPPVELIQPAFYNSFDLNFEKDTWYKIRVEAEENYYKVFVNDVLYIEFTDATGFAKGSVGLISYSTSNVHFRNFKYEIKHYLDFYLDNIKVDGGFFNTDVQKPTYAIDFYLNNSKIISNYTINAKSKYTIPIINGSHFAKWVFKKLDNNETLTNDFSYIDNIVLKEAKVIGAKMEEEFIECGGHRAVKMLIDNLVFYYNNHHEACKGKRDIWIVE